MTNELKLHPPVGSALSLGGVVPLEGQTAGIMIARGPGRHIERVADYFVLLIVRKGVLHIEEDGREFEVHAGESLLLWPDRLHRGTRDHDEELQFFWLHFRLTNQAMITSLPATPPIPQHTQLARPDFVTELLRRYMEDQDSGQLQPLSAALYVWMILNEVAETRPSPDMRAATVLAGNASTYIRTHFHEKITATHVANAVGYNAQYVGRIFQRTYHITLAQAIRGARVGHAKTLLLNTNGNIGEIAKQSGFTDPTYFQRVFKQSEGVTPLRFRRLHARMTVNTH